MYGYIFLVCPLLFPKIDINMYAVNVMFSHLNPYLKVIYSCLYLELFLGGKIFNDNDQQSEIRLIDLNQTLKYREYDRFTNHRLSGMPFILNACNSYDSVVTYKDSLTFKLARELDELEGFDVSRFLQFIRPNNGEIPR